ncbi:NYN domain containing protein [Nitzschia inconspicua]|uniref:NYN domain containing protein n=1 Tax=Nitzschia inconspicua TaxID=303405 RepID=A0A9K3KK44_9STRA|nr:NYN domain containing protein [Nitzschia inconspicua]
MSLRPVANCDVTVPVPNEHKGKSEENASFGPADVAIFWDYENVRIPAWCHPSTATQGIRNKVAKYGRVVEKRIYYDSRQPTEVSVPRAELDSSGFTFVDCPSRNRKETLDKKIIVDIMCFAWERVSTGSKACIVLITSDGDYSYALARLRDIGVFAVVMYRPVNVSKVLINSANVVLSWESDVLGGPPTEDGNESSMKFSMKRDSTLQRYQLPASINSDVLGGPTTEDGNESSMKFSMKRDSTLQQYQLPASINSASVKLAHPPIPRRDGATIESSKSTCNKTINETQIQAIQIKQPNQQQRNQSILLLLNAVLDAQYRNVKKGTSVFSSWASESHTASSFYENMSNKNRKLYQKLLNLGTQKGYIEWGPRDMFVNGTPVVKVKKRTGKAKGLSFLRLTYSGLAILKPSIPSSQGSGWIPVLRKRDDRVVKQSDTHIVDQNNCQASAIESINNLQKETHDE